MILNTPEECNATFGHTARAFPVTQPEQGSGQRQEQVLRMMSSQNFGGPLAKNPAELESSGLQARQSHRVTDLDSYCDAIFDNFLQNLSKVSTRSGHISMPSPVFFLQLSRRFTSCPVR